MANVVTKIADGELDAEAKIVNKNRSDLVRETVSISLRDVDDRINGSINDLLTKISGLKSGDPTSPLARAAERLKRSLENKDRNP